MACCRAGGASLQRVESCRSPARTEASVLHQKGESVSNSYNRYAAASHSGQARAAPHSGSEKIRHADLCLKKRIRYVDLCLWHGGGLGLSRHPFTDLDLPPFRFLLPLLLSVCAGVCTVQALVSRRPSSPMIAGMLCRWASVPLTVPHTHTRPIHAYTSLTTRTHRDTHAQADLLSEVIDVERLQLRKGPRHVLPQHMCGAVKQVKSHTAFALCRSCRECPSAFAGLYHCRAFHDMLPSGA